MMKLDAGLTPALPASDSTAAWGCRRTATKVYVLNQSQLTSKIEWCAWMLMVIK